MTTIAIVDYGMGNYHSVERALRHAAPEATVRLCKNASEIDAADRVVFPGQGAMADCIRTLEEAGLRGFRIGEAEVSAKHPGFIVNHGNATHQDMLDLVQECQKRIKEQFDIDLHLEWKIIG